MHTITFYSYKGGVGRSLLVANAAKYLSTLGKAVFALDLDLEAPGLQYKFELDSDAVRSEPAPGVVDILVDFLRKGALPSSLKAYARTLDASGDVGAIHLMRAGTAPRGDYWRLLSQVDWYGILYGSQPVGVPFFLELRERIRAEYSPDFLLIDARTGITEMGGIATTLLPDTVVCLGLATIEHLEGLRAVMRGIKETTAQAGTSVKLVSVVSRLSQRKEGEDEELTRIRAFLNEPVRADGTGLDVDEVIALHTEPVLEAGEQILVAGKRSPHELPLLRDYLKLFSKIIPADVIRPHVGQLVQRAASRLLDDPDGAQSDLEALTAYCADQEALKALIKLYQLRKAPFEKIIATAALMWQVGPKESTPDPLLVEIAKSGYAEPRPGELQRKYADFAEGVWRTTGMQDTRLAMTLVSALLPDRRGKAIRILSDYIDQAESPDPAATARLIELFRSGPTPKMAFQAIDRFKASAQAPEFYAAWAKLILDQKDRSQAQRLLQDPTFRISALRAIDPATAYRMLKFAGGETSSSMLLEALEKAATLGGIGAIRELAELFDEEGQLDRFEHFLEDRIPKHILEEILNDVRRGIRRSRYLRP